MKTGKELLGNLVYTRPYPKTSVEAGAAAFKPCAKDLEAVHIRLDLPDPSTWRKKKYYHISKYQACSRLDEWIFEHLVDQKEYAGYLEQYRAARQNGEIGDIDEPILKVHYRPRAVEILSRKKSFDPARWSEKRVCMEYRRRSHLYCKDGTEFGFDFRNPVQSLFIHRRNSDKEIVGIGGFGGSSSREDNTFFTAVFYQLGKQARIPNYLLIYNGLNEFEYAGRRYRPVLTPGFGSNFDLDERLSKEIRKRGFHWNRLRRSGSI